LDIRPDIAGAGYWALYTSMGSESSVIDQNPTTYTKIAASNRKGNVHGTEPDNAYPLRAAMGCLFRIGETGMEALARFMHFTVGNPAQQSRTHQVGRTTRLP
ncbi:hypothetical protein FRC02_006842, partial [Tulasnella sp. 418]